MRSGERLPSYPRTVGLHRPLNAFKVPAKPTPKPAKHGCIKLDFTVKMESSDGPNPCWNIANETRMMIGTRTNTVHRPR